MESRAKADAVLVKFGHIGGTKLLYSVRNDRFYICIKSKEGYQEYLVEMDEVSNLKIMELKIERKHKKILSRAFSLQKYHRDFVTSRPDAKFTQSYPSYFVVKDAAGNRYGEFSLSYLTIPSPIDTVVYAYLTKKMSELGKHGTK